ncbi:M15 family metallopeptidase [Jidongwangia harbinensis]|uniref:M15 family metallopeptidase n=1 Tax=Jidongwangia harbinensis TaxID=2878561 RepID=UPI001CD9D381|nr:M15 family metallopeptidase [Jidongwangia harbinensis]MCA2212554.1 M15 family metallopeptidase [Jidongwangia harbinensis]
MGIEQVNSRIASIQSRIIALQTQQAGQVTKTASGTSTSGTSFATHLSDAVANSSQTTAASDKTYKLNSKGVPVELAAYGNGKVPPNALGQVGNTGHRLWAPAAEQLNSMIADAKRDGVKIGITDSYRSYDEQVDVARRKGLYSQGGLAAKPGTSEHGWGMAADLDLNGKALAWMRENAGKYDFVENTPRETWHWAYKPKS